MFTLTFYSFMCTKKSFDGCGTTMGCVKGLKCTTPENCEALAKYYYNNATQMMHFSVTFKNYAWVALAQNTIDKPKMVKYSIFLLSSILFLLSFYYLSITFLSFYYLSIIFYSLFIIFLLSFYYLSIIFLLSFYYLSIIFLLSKLLKTRFDENAFKFFAIHKATTTVLVPYGSCFLF